MGSPGPDQGYIWSSRRCSRASCTWPSGEHEDDGDGRCRRGGAEAGLVLSAGRRWSTTCASRSPSGASSTSRRPRTSSTLRASCSRASHNLAPLPRAAGGRRRRPESGLRQTPAQVDEAHGRLAVAARRLSEPRPHQTAATSLPVRAEGRRYPGLMPSAAARPLRSVADRLPARRATPTRPWPTGCSPAHGRRDAPADRGHRRRAQPARADRQRARDARVARPRLGRRAGAPERPGRPLPRRRRQARGQRRRPTAATAPPSWCRRGPRSGAASPATTASAATGTSAPVRDAPCASASPTTGATGWHDLVRGDVAFENADIEDFVVLRSNGDPMFLLANAVDDADMGITHVIRGEDHVNSTPKYLLLQQALGCTQPEAFAHMPLLVNEQPQEALEASRRRVDGRLPRPRLPARGAWPTTSPCSAGARPTASRSARSPRSSSCTGWRT